MNNNQTSEEIRHIGNWSFYLKRLTDKNIIFPRNEPSVA